MDGQIQANSPETRSDAELSFLHTLGAIDCDMHPVIPGISALMPYLPRVWQAAVSDRGMPPLESIGYPSGAPVTARSDWREADGNPPRGPDRYREAVLDRWQLRGAIANCLYGVHLPMSEDIAAVMASAVNDWLVAEWLDPEPRLRSSIVVPWQSPTRAVEEIERCSKDRRFVQVLLPVMTEAPLGRRHYWPIYEAAQKHGLTIGIHAGSAYRFPVTPVGWPSWYVEDVAAQSIGFQGQVASLICEGVFTTFPELKVVLLESGVTWFVPFLWRLSKFWRGTRSEVPWVKRSPIQIARDHFRLTAQPFDAPADPTIVARQIERFGSDEMLLFASDYPHAHVEGDEPLPAGIGDDLAARIAVDNVLATYPAFEGIRS